MSPASGKEPSGRIHALYNEAASASADTDEGTASGDVLTREAQNKPALGKRPVYKGSTGPLGRQNSAPRSLDNPLSVGCPDSYPDLMALCMGGGDAFGILLLRAAVGTS